MIEQTQNLTELNAAGLLGSLMGAFGCLMIGLLRADAFFLVISCAFLMFCIFLILIRESGNQDLMNPLNFLLLAYFLGVVSRSLYLGITENDAILHDMLSGSHPTDLALGLTLASIGMLFTFLGFFSSGWLKIPLEKIPLLTADRWSSRRLFLVVALFCLVATVSTIMFIQKMGMAGILLESISAKRRLIIHGAEYKYAALGYYRWGAGFFVYAFLLYLAFFLDVSTGKKKLHLILLISLFLLASIFPVLVSSRTSLLSMIIALLIFYHYFKKPLSSIQLTGFFLICLFVVFSMGALRAVAHRQTENYSAFYNLEKVADSVYANRNFLDITKTTHIAETFPQREPLQYGWSMTGWLFAPVPREVWKEKPMVRPGPFVSKTVYEDRNLKTGVPPGLVGEVIMNFGVWSVPPLLYLFGWLLGLVYRNFAPLAVRHKNSALLYSLTIFVLSFELIGGDTSGAFLGLVMDLAPMTGALVFISRQNDER